MTPIEDATLRLCAVIERWGNMVQPHGRWSASDEYAAKVMLPMARDLNEGLKHTLDLRQEEITPGERSIAQQKDDADQAAQRG